MRDGILLACALALTGCGSDNGGTGTGGFGVNATTCPFLAKLSSMSSTSTSADCGSCNSSKCGSTYSDCYGSLYTGGSPGGKCSAYLSCVCACGATDAACFGACSSKVTADCTTCQTASSNCSTTNCATQCQKTTTSPDMAMSTTGGTQCALLAACCPNITNATMRSGCEGTVANGNEMGCMYELQGEKAAGYCT
jgi:hypothetical protein